MEILNVLTLFILLKLANCEFIPANVTKSAAKEIKPLFVTNSTVSSPSPTSNKTALRSQQPGVLQNKDAAFPKAISVNAETSNSGFAIFPIPHGSFPENEGLEETFTYQVTKQRRSPMSNVAPPADFMNQVDFLQEQMKSESTETIQNYVKVLNQLITEKANNISTTVDKINQTFIGNISSLNSTVNQLNVQVANLTALSKETTRTLRVLQYFQDKERNSMMEQILNLTHRVERQRLEDTEKIRKLSESLSGFQEMLGNTTDEIRVHESYLRHGQQTMASMKGTIEKSLDRIAGLETDGGPQWAEQTTGCGGVIIANSGIISYKFRQPYFNNERCVWIIRANRRSKINLQLLEDGFQNQSNSDLLTVTEFAEDQHPVSLITSSRLEHGNNALHTFQGPVVFVTFYSDGQLPGTGFTLRFDGTGNRTDGASIGALRHLNVHLSAPFGEFKYPYEQAKTYQPNELVTLAINPHNAKSLKILMMRSDLEKDEYCEFDSISFYGSVTGSYALTKRYCQHGEEFHGEMIQSSDGIFLAIFRSDASTQFGGFHFSWEME